MRQNSSESNVVVYQVTNLVDDKKYVGVTKRGLRERKRQHLYHAKRGTGHVLHNAIRKHGKNNFVFEVVSDFIDDYDLAKTYEWELICATKPAYNLAAGGEGGTLSLDVRRRIGAAHTGMKHSPAARANMSEAQRLRGQLAPASAETRAKMRAARVGRKMPEAQRVAMIGRKLPEDTRAKISAALKGRTATKGRAGQPVPQEVREKIRRALKNAQWVDTPKRAASRFRTGTTAAQEARKITVRCLDDGNVFESVKAAATFYGVDRMQLGAAIRGKRPYRGRRFERLAKPPRDEA